MPESGRKETERRRKARKLRRAEQEEGAYYAFPLGRNAYSYRSFRRNNWRFGHQIDENFRRTEPRKPWQGNEYLVKVGDEEGTRTELVLPRTEPIEREGKLYPNVDTPKCRRSSVATKGPRVSSRRKKTAKKKSLKEKAWWDNRLYRVEEQRRIEMETANVDG